MTTTINGRTPEEIKKGLECCSVDGLSCSNCSYCVSCDADIHALERDALALIQQLEERIVDLNKTSEQFERERNAAVAETESLRAEIDAINEDYLSGIHTVRESAQPKWISVEERLPEELEDVLVFSRNGSCTWTEVAHLMCNQWWRVGIPMINVTHWMPLPSTEGIE